LLHAGVALEADRLHIEVVFRPDANLLADLDRRKGEGGGGGLADADGVGGEGRHRSDGRKQKSGERQKPARRRGPALLSADVRRRDHVATIDQVFARREYASHRAASRRKAEAKERVATPRRSHVASSGEGRAHPRAGSLRTHVVGSGRRRHNRLSPRTTSRFGPNSTERQGA